MHRLLPLDREADRIDHHQQPIPRHLDEPAVMLGDLRIEQLGPYRL
jgi:hypothetical protein